MINEFGRLDNFGRLERKIRKGFIYMCPKSENRGVNRIAALFTVKIFAAHKA